MLYWLRSYDNKNKTGFAENSADRTAKGGEVILVNNAECAHRNIPQLSDLG